MIDRPFGEDTEALVTDRYLEDLLLSADGGVAPDPAQASDADVALPTLDPALRRTARRLSDDLVRVHPSFRFEERLALRLAEAAEAMRRPAVVRTAASIAALPPVLREAASLPASTAVSAPLLGSALASAAVTSAALSVGAAVVAIAWRRGLLPRRASYLPRRPGRSAGQVVRA